MNKILIFASLFISAQVVVGQGDVCAEMENICTALGVYYTGTSGSIAEEGNDYGCLVTQLNPGWFYLEIEEAGGIEFELYADSDIDFIMWGPFSSLEDAKSKCGTYGSLEDSPITDCSYSGTSYETPEIPYGIVGEVYVLMVTNYAAFSNFITINKISGEGVSNCGDYTPPIPCVSEVGTFYGEQYGEIINIEAEIELYIGNSFIIRSNNDFILPNDTIESPIGDGIYSAQIMWLVFTEYPLETEPNYEDGFTGFIIPTKDLYDVNNVDSPIIQEFGFGTYYFVPYVGDDGIGGNGNVANGTNDNGSITWDLNANWCYDKGEPVMVTYYDILGNDPYALNEVSIYPNPSNDLITINFGNSLEQDYQVIIYNLLGQEVYLNKNVTDNNLIIEKEQLAAGIFILTVLNANNKEIYKSKLIIE